MVKTSLLIKKKYRWFCLLLLSLFVLVVYESKFWISLLRNEKNLDCAEINNNDHPNINMSEHIDEVDTTNQLYSHHEYHGNNSQCRLWIDEALSDFNLTEKYDLNYIRSSFMPKFTSGNSQDWALFVSIFSNFNTVGNYIELAANDYKTGSNSYFFDKCLGFNGLCVEPVTKYHENIINNRNCKLIPNCVWFEENKTITFIEQASAAHSHIAGTGKHNSGKKMQLKCITFKQLMEIYYDLYGTYHLDFLSLDVEGSELLILNSIDWENIFIDVIVVEVHTVSVQKLLESKGYELKLYIWDDEIYVHKKAINKMKLINNWIKTNYKLLNFSVIEFLKDNPNKVFNKDIKFWSDTQNVSCFHRGDYSILPSRPFHLDLNRGWDKLGNEII